MENSKIISLLFFILIYDRGCAVTDISILNCSILFIHMDYEFEKIYIYEISNKKNHLVYYYPIGENDLSIPPSGLQNYINKQLSNGTHIYFNDPSEANNSKIEIIIIAKEGVMSTITTDLFYQKNKSCFTTSKYYIDGNIIDCCILNIQIHPKSRTIDQIYIYEKTEMKKILIYYFNSNDSLNSSNLENNLINKNSSNSTQIEFFKQTNDYFYKLSITILSGGFLSENLNLNMIYDNQTKLFKIVSDFMEFHAEINNNNILSILPDFKIRIIDQIYLYDIKNSVKKELLYFLQKEANWIKTSKKDSLIDMKLSNATYIKLLPSTSTKVFYKIEIVVVSRGFASQLLNDLFYDIMKQRYTMISNSETRIYGVEMYPEEPFFGNNVIVSLKYSLKPKHYLNRLLFQASDNPNIPRINICAFLKTSKYAIETIDCPKDTQWARRVKPNFKNISKEIEFTQVIDEDRNFTFVWNLRTNNMDNDLDRINVLYHFTINAKDNMQVKNKIQDTTTNNENLIIYLLAGLFITTILLAIIIVIIKVKEKTKNGKKSQTNQAQDHQQNNELQCLTSNNEAENKNSQEDLEKNNNV